jgi:hypothetical protein
MMLLNWAVHIVLSKETMEEHVISFSEGDDNRLTIDSCLQ